MTNLQEFVFEYLDGNTKGLAADSCIFSNVDQVVNSILSYHSRRAGWNKERTWDTRKRIGQFAEKYLSQLERLTSVSSSIGSARERIEAMKNSEPDSTIILMTAHQPNLFAYSGVMKKIVLLSSVASKIQSITNGRANVVCFFGIADHDFANNKWVRSAEIPSPGRREGVLRLNVKLERKGLNLPSNQIPKPPEETLESWRLQISNWISENSSLAKKFFKGRSESMDLSSVDIAERNFEDYWDLVKDVHTAASSLADFSSFLLSSICLSIWREPVIFANFSDCFTVFDDEYDWVIRNRSRYQEALRENESRLISAGIDSGLSRDVDELSPVWLKCHCGSKVRLTLSESSAAGKCLTCGSEATYEVGELIELTHKSPDLFEPRSMAMPILFSRAFDMSCYVGGIGSLGYLMHSKAISERLESPFPPTPFWYAEDKFQSLEKMACLCEVDRICKAYSLNCDANPLDDNISSKVLALKDQLESKITKDEVQKNSVSERDKQLLEKISLHCEGNACMIDYVINVGLHSAWKQWCGFLTENGQLHSKVYLQSIFDIEQAGTR